MFDAVLLKTRAPQANLAGLGLSLTVSAAVVSALALAPAEAPKPVAKPVDVTFVRSMPQPAAPPPPAAPAAAAAQPKTNPAPRKPKRELVLRPQPTEPVPQQEAAPEPTPEPEAAGDSSAGAMAEGASPGGVPGGVAGGVAGGVLGGTGQSVLPFGVGMTRPVQVAGSPPVYTREAIAARVEGKVLVRCVITTEGAIQDCRLIKGVPMLDQIALESLRTSRFTPVMYRGRPEAVQYLFTFNFKIP